MRPTFFMLGALLLLTGCVDDPPPPAAAPLLPAAQAGDAKPGDPQSGGLKPGDILNIAVAGEDELDGHYTVLDDGTVALPLVGSVDAKGGNVAAFQERLRLRLMAGYFTHPVVTVTLTSKLGASEAGTAEVGPAPPPVIRQSETGNQGY